MRCTAETPCERCAPTVEWGVPKICGRETSNATRRRDERRSERARRNAEAYERSTARAAGYPASATADPYVKAPRVPVFLRWLPWRWRYRLEAWLMRRATLARFKRMAAELRTDPMAREAAQVAMYGNRAQRRAYVKSSPAELAMRTDRTVSRVAKRKAARGYERGHVRKREVAAIVAAAPAPELEEGLLDRIAKWWRGQWWAPWSPAGA